MRGGGRGGGGRGRECEREQVRRTGKQERGRSGGEEWRRKGERGGGGRGSVRRTEGEVGEESESKVLQPGFHWSRLHHVKSAIWP